MWRGAQVHQACARCGTRLHRRKPDSLNRTWALVIAAAILYLPANLLPVMITRTIFGAQYDTIMSGIIYFWVSGAWGLAAIIFIASFLVPLFKLAALAIMAWSAGRHSDWRRQEREERKLRLVHDEADDVVDDWDATVDASVAQGVLATLGPHHRSALTLRYLDGLPVPEVAEAIGRTVHATEALLVRARTAFRRAYETGGSES